MSYKTKAPVLPSQLRMPKHRQDKHNQARHRAPVPG